MLKAVITIICDSTTIRLRPIARACFHSTRAKKWTCQFFVVVVS